MIKVELIYKVSMHGTDWLMSEEEYKEFRNAANNLPIFFRQPFAYPESMLKTSMKEPLSIDTGILAQTLTNGSALKSLNTIVKAAEKITSTDYGKPGGDMTAIATAEKTSDGLNVIEVKIEEPIEPERLVKPKEVEKEREQNYNFTKRKTDPRDFTKYVQMYKDGADQKEIIENLAEGFGIAQSTATQIYYSKVRPRALKQIESEKVVILDEDKPSPGKYFTDSERERIQKNLGLK